MKTASSNLSAPKTHEYLVCLLVDDFEIGDTFTNWPLHVTVVAWFTVDDSEYFTRLAELRSAKIPSFTAKVGERRKMSRHTVNVVRKTDELQLLHETMMSLVKSTGRLLTKEDFYYEKYQPHITHQKNIAAEPGDELRFEHVYLIGKDIHARQKTIIAKYRLGSI